MKTERPAATKKMCPLNRKDAKSAEKRKLAQPPHCNSLTCSQGARILGTCRCRKPLGVRRIPALCLRVVQGCLGRSETKAPGCGALQTLRAVRLRLCRAAFIRGLNAAFRFNDWHLTHT